jgi:hypothetical protein
MRYRAMGHSQGKPYVCRQVLARMTDAQRQRGGAHANLSRHAQSQVSTTKLTTEEDKTP